MLPTTPRAAIAGTVRDTSGRPIANAELCRIAAVDTLRASKMLRSWVDRGLLEPLAGRSRSQAAYRKPTLVDEQPSLLADAGGDPTPGGPGL